MRRRLRPRVARPACLFRLFWPRWRLRAGPRRSAARPLAQPGRPRARGAAAQQRRLVARASGGAAAAPCAQRVAQQPHRQRQAPLLRAVRRCTCGGQKANFTGRHPCACTHHPCFASTRHRSSAVLVGAPAAAEGLNVPLATHAHIQPSRALPAQGSAPQRCPHVRLRPPEDHPRIATPAHACTLPSHAITACAPAPGAPPG